MKRQVYIRALHTLFELSPCRIIAIQPGLLNHIHASILNKPVMRVRPIGPLVSKTLQGVHLIILIMLQVCYVCCLSLPFLETAKVQSVSVALFKNFCS